MEKKAFIYGGYTFTPDGSFKDHGINPGKREIYEISRALHYISMGKAAKVADGDELFDYDEFYKAAGNYCTDDIFICKENGERYVPCPGVLAVFDREHTWDEVRERYNYRVAAREEHERFVKREAVRSAMQFTEEQHEAVIELSKVIQHCKDIGLDFAVDGTNVYIFRADLLKDITTDMAAMDGQERIEVFADIISDAWDARDGLYANVK